MKTTLLLAAAFFALTLTTLAQPLRADEAKTPKKAEGGKTKVACVGDSITYGAGVKDREHNSYPAVLQKLLGDRADVKNFGNSGSTLLKNGDKPYWKQKEYQAAKDFPDIVIIKLGTNDSKPQNWAKKSEFLADAKDLIEQFASLPSKPQVWVCHPVPVIRPGNFGIRDEVVKDEAIPLLDEAAKDKGAHVIDLYAALSGKPELFPDKVHPNAEGAKLMAETVYAALKAQAAEKAKKE